MYFDTRVKIGVSRFEMTTCTFVVIWCYTYNFVCFMLCDIFSVFTLSPEFKELIVEIISRVRLHLFKQVGVVEFIANRLVHVLRRNNQYGTPFVRLSDDQLHLVHFILEPFHPPTVRPEWTKMENNQ